MIDCESDFRSFPPTVQDIAEDILQQERREFESQISFLTQEIENSRIAFDRYRERARESLLKTANDQQSAETSIASLKEQLKVRKNNRSVVVS